MDKFEDPKAPLEPTLAGDSPDFTDHPDFQVEVEQTVVSPAAGASEEALDSLPGLDSLEMTQPQDGYSLPSSVERTLEAALSNTLVGDEEEGSAQPAPKPVTSSIERASSSRFELLGVLGEGGMGKVFRARDLQIEGRKVALKVLHSKYSQNPRFRDLFFQEIKAAQGFVSEHAVQIRDTGQMQDGSLFLTMDMVAGESLRRKLRREGVLTPAHAFEITRQILLGLASGHEHGLVHRDVKPTNIMLAARVPKTAQNPHGVRVRLLDFGIAGLVDEQEEGQRAGTPKYMSPEQVQGQRLDARSDLFAVGVVLYEMLSGARPFEGDTLAEVETSILENQIKPLIRDLGSLPRPVKRILNKALKKDREKRFQSAAEFIAELDRSKITSPKSSMGWLSIAGMTLFAAAAGAEAKYILDQREELDGLRAETKSALEEAESSAGEAQASFDLELTQKGAEIVRLQERLTEEGDYSSKFVDLQRDYNMLREENRTLQRRTEELERRTEELKTAKFFEQPEAKTAAAFDELLRRIDLGAGVAAVEYLREGTPEGVFDAGKLDGSELVSRLAAAAAALEAADKEDGIDLAMLTTAGTLLAKVGLGREDFERQATNWLTLFPAETAPYDRLANLDITTRFLERGIDELRQEGASTQEADWEVVASGPDDQDPQNAFNHAALYGAESISSLVDRYASHLQATVVEGDVLNLPTLEAAETLSEWGPWLSELGSVLQTDSAKSIREFYCARSWYLDLAPEPLFAEIFVETPELRTDAPHDDWRAQLSLQLALSTNDSYPLPANCSAVMRHTWSDSESTMWFLERLDSKDSEGWQIERRIHDFAGNTTGRPQTYTVTREEDAFFTAGIKGLDLRAFDQTIRVALFQPMDHNTLPKKPWVRSLDFAAYENFMASGPVPCLVIQAGESELWFSPELGLVRESRAGTYERELIFYSAPR